MRPVDRGVEVNHADPAFHDPSILTRRDVSRWSGSTEEKPRIVAQSGARYPLLNRLTRMLRDLESDGLAGFLLNDRGPRHDGFAVNHVARSQLHQIAGSQLAVDRQIEKREIAYSALDFQQDPDGPDFLGLQGRFLSDDFAFVPRNVGSLVGVSEGKGLHELIPFFMGRNQKYCLSTRMVAFATEANVEDQLSKLLLIATISTGGCNTLAST